MRKSPFTAVTAALFGLSFIISSKACFPLAQPGFYSAPASYSSSSYGSSGSYGTPYVRARAMASDTTRQRIAASADDASATLEYDNDASTGCSHRFVGRRLNCATPVETQTPVNGESDCRRACIDYFLSRCASYRFDAAGGVCELYNSIPPLPVTAHSNTRGDDTDLFSFRDETTLPDGDTTDYDTNDVHYNKKRTRRYTLQNGVALTATSRDSALKNAPNVLKLPGLFLSGSTDGCTPAIASDGPSSVYATVDVECFKNLRGGSETANPLAPLIAQFHRGDTEIGRALTPLTKTLAPSPLAAAGLNSLALPALPSLTELLASLQPQGLGQNLSQNPGGLGGLGTMGSTLIPGHQLPQPQGRSQQQMQSQSQIFGSNHLLGQLQESQNSQSQGQTVLPFMTSSQPQSQLQMLAMPSAPPAVIPAAAFAQKTALLNIFNAAGGAPSPLVDALPLGKLPTHHRSGANRNPNRIDVDPLVGSIIIPETPDCIDRSQARIQVVDGIFVVASAGNTFAPLATIKISSAETCLHICRANAHLDGTRFARACRAAAFDHVAGSCLILDDAITPNGELGYAPSPHSVYFEKFCIPENELPLACDDVVQRIPQHTLDARAAGTGAVLTAASQTECLRRCVTAQKRLGFECSSTSYYFDWENSNCYLSRFTRLSRPDLYVGEHKQLVDYLELAPCMRRAWQHDDITKDSVQRQPDPTRASADPFLINAVNYNDEFEEDSRSNIRRSSKQAASGGSGSSALFNGFSVNSVHRQDAKRNERKDSSREDGPEEFHHDTKALGAKTLKDTRQFDDPRSGEAEWSAWTSCDSRSDLRSRHRGCSQNNLSANESDSAAPDVEMAPCGRPADAHDEEINQNRVNSHDDEKNNSTFATIKPFDSENSLRSNRHNEGDKDPSSNEGGMRNAWGCNPRTRCCSKVLRVAPVARATGCTIGYRVLGDGTTVACMPDDC